MRSRKFHEWSRLDVGHRTVCGLGVGSHHGANAVSVVSALDNVEAADRCGNCMRMRDSIGTSSSRFEGEPPFDQHPHAPSPSVARGASIDELAASLTERELDVMMHATGWQSRSPLFRNHYCASEGHHSWNEIQALVARGLMKQSRAPSDLSGGDTVFAVTAIGVATLRGKGKVSRAQSGEAKAE